MTGGAGTGSGSGGGVGEAGGDGLGDEVGVGAVGAWQAIKMMVARTMKSLRIGASLDFADVLELPWVVWIGD
jgi:hypothetical protein